MVAERGNYRGESSADDYADSHIEDVAPHYKLLEFGIKPADFLSFFVFCSHKNHSSS